MTNPYVYILQNPLTDEFYIGCRWANKVPAKDDLGIHYFTSSKKVKPRFNEFIIKEIYEFDTAKNAIDYEYKLIKENKGNKNLLNDALFKNSVLSIDYSNPVRNNKLSIASRKRFLQPELNPMYNQESRDKVRDSKIGDKNPNYGKQGCWDHNNSKLTCDICNTTTTRVHISRHHGDGICNKEYQIINNKNGMTYITSNLKQWCVDNYVNLSVCKYALKHSGYFLKQFVIRAI